LRNADDSNAEDGGGGGGGGGGGNESLVLCRGENCIEPPLSSLRLPPPVIIMVPPID
jgi:hypothetical protein